MTDKQQQQQAKTASPSKCQSTDDDDSASCSLWRTLLTLFNTINHVLVLLTTGYLVYLARDLSSNLNLHILLCTIGYVLLMSEAIIVLTGSNVWTRRLSRRSNSHLHWILQVTGAAFSVAGVYVMYRGRKRHFHGVHALTGIVSVGCIGLLFLSGLPALFAARLRKVLRPVVGKFLHNFLGIACFALGMVCQCYGYKKSWLRRLGGDEMVTVLTVTTGMITFISCVGALGSLWEQLKGLLRCY